MKNVFKTLAILLVSISMSCENESPKHGTEGRTNPENKEITNTTNYKDNGNFENSVEVFDDATKVKDSINANWDLKDPKRQQSLFERFDMTEEQIISYEKALFNWWNFDKENPYDKLSADKRIKEEHRILKDILNDAQFKRYKSWANDNDERN